MYVLKSYTYTGGHSTNVWATTLGVGADVTKLMEHVHNIEDWNFAVRPNKEDYWFVGHSVYPDYTITPILEIK